MKKILFLFLTAAFVQNALAQNPAPTPAAAAPRSAQAVQAAQAAGLAQYGVRIEPDSRLIVIMAALETGGLATPLTAPGSSFRQTLQQDLPNISPDLKQRLTGFVERYKTQHSSSTAAAQITAPFVSLAFVLSPVPDLADPPPSDDLPSDVVEALDFGTLVREFYKTSGIASKLPDYVKAYQLAGDKMQRSTGLMVGTILDYLHTRPDLTVIERTRVDNKAAKKKNETSYKINERTRRFFIVPDLLAPPGTINFRNIRDDYYVVVPPETNLSVSEARRAYLQFVTDPIILKNAKDVATLNPGVKQLLDQRQKAGATVSPDVFLAVVRSFVAAADARQVEYEKTQIATAEARRKIDAAQGVDAKRAVSAELDRRKQAFADEAALKLAENYEQGAVLDFYFADQLKGLESAGFDVSSSFRDMILSFDATKESTRLTQVADARQRALAARAPGVNKNLELPTKLLEVDELIKAKNYTEADAQLKTLLEQNPDEPRIFYTLGRVASASADGTFDESLLNDRLGRAAAYYRNAILAANQNTDPALLSLAHVALGRILEFNDQNEAAIKEYEAAISLKDVSGGAYKEAVALKDKLSKKQ